MIPFVSKVKFCWHRIEKNTNVFKYQALFVNLQNFWTVENALRNALITSEVTLGLKPNINKGLVIADFETVADLKD